MKFQKEIEIDDEIVQEINDNYLNRAVDANNYLEEKGFTVQSISEPESYWDDKYLSKAASCLVEGDSIYGDDYRNGGGDVHFNEQEQIVSACGHDLGNSPLFEIYNIFGVGLSEFPLANALAARIDKEGY